MSALPTVENPLATYPADVLRLLDGLTGKTHEFQLAG
jgi:hypothetical protein